MAGRKKMAEDDVALFDAVLSLVGKLDEESKQEIARILLILLACVEDKAINCDKLAMIANRIATTMNGESTPFHFDLSGTD